MNILHFTAPTQAQTCRWNGCTFKVWPSQQTFRRFPGVYVYTHLLEGRFHPLYVGEAEDVAAALAKTKTIFPELDLLAQHVHCLTVRDDADRRKNIAREMIELFNPPLNTDHRTSAASGKISTLIPDRWQAA